MLWTVIGDLKKSIEAVSTFTVLNHTKVVAGYGRCSACLNKGSTRAHQGPKTTSHISVRPKRDFIYNLKSVRQRTLFRL